MNGKTLLILFVLIGALVGGCDDAETDYGLLEISDSKFQADAEGGTLKIRIHSSETWKASSGTQWCIPYNEKGEDNEELVLSVTANVEKTERNTQVTVVCGTKTATIEVNQAASGLSAEEYHYTLPVIFHVIYQDKTDNQQYVSPARLSSILNSVNELYKGSTGNVDMNLSFTLATIDPNGQTMQTPGVEYIEWQGEYPIDCEQFMNDRSGRYAAYLWDPNLYINIMVYAFKDVSATSTILGISNIPYSTAGETYLEGLLQIDYSYMEKPSLLNPHCVSINSQYIDSNRPTSDIKTTVAHELGHYLGLYHVFSEDENGNTTQDCTDSDYCEDTPTYDKIGYDLWTLMNTGASFGFLAQRRNCHTGEVFTARNIMDYAYCYSNQFTPDQLARVRHVLMYSPLIPGPKITPQSGVRSAGEDPLDLPIRVTK